MPRHRNARDVHQISKGTYSSNATAACGAAVHSKPLEGPEGKWGRAVTVLRVGPVTLPPTSMPKSRATGSESGGVCLRHLRRPPAGGPFQRLDGGRDVVVQHRVELVRQGGAEVVARPLGLRAVDHADRPLEP